MEAVVRLVVGLALEELATLDIVETDEVEEDFELEVDEGGVVVEDVYPEGVTVEEEVVVPIEETVSAEVVEVGAGVDGVLCPEVLNRTT